MMGMNDEEVERISNGLINGWNRKNQIQNLRIVEK